MGWEKREDSGMGEELSEQKGERGDREKTACGGMLIVQKQWTEFCYLVRTLLCLGLDQAVAAYHMEG